MRGILDGVLSEGVEGLGLGELERANQGMQNKVTSVRFARFGRKSGEFRTVLGQSQFPRTVVCEGGFEILGDGLSPRSCKSKKLVID